MNKARKEGFGTHVGKSDERYSYLTDGVKKETPAAYHYQAEWKKKSYNKALKSAFISSEKRFSTNKKPSPGPGEYFGKDEDEFGGFSGVVLLH